MDGAAPSDSGPPVAPKTLAEGFAAGYYITPTLSPEPMSERQASLNEGAVWVLSSARPGNGIPQLLSDSVRPPPAPLRQQNCLSFAAPPNLPPPSALLPSFSPAGGVLAVRWHRPPHFVHSVPPPHRAV